MTIQDAMDRLAMVPESDEFDRLWRALGEVVRVVSRMPPPPEPLVAYGAFCPLSARVNRYFLKRYRRDG